MPTPLASMQPYLPAFTLHQVARDPNPITAPRQENFSSVVLFADISGFTTLAERLAEQGPAGAEELSAALNDYFGQLTAIIAEWGGDVVKFAGDALLALWPVEGLPAAAVAAAAQCALVAQKELHNYSIGSGERLAMRMAVGVGQITTMHVGGVFGRWEFVLAGQPINQVSVAQTQAQPGQVVLTLAAAATLGVLAEGDLVGADAPFLVLRRLREPQFPQALELPPLSATAENALRAYIPGAVMARLMAGQDAGGTGGDWLGELRRVTVLFVNLPAIHYNLPLAQAHQLVQTLQKALYHYEGSLNKLSVDDKGVTLVAALGLPPLAHEDDAARGALVALRMQTELQALGMASAIGVATGQVFCGAVGGANRREYTVLGDVVNLAARLMQAAPNTILCELNAMQAAQARVAFDPLPPLQVKGKAEPVAVFHPTGEKKTALRAQTEIVGRMPEREALAEGIQSLLRGGTGFNVDLIEGEAGIGKSRLVDEVRRQAQALGVHTLSGTGDAVESRTLYHAWRAVFNHMLDVELFADPERLRRHVRLALGPQLMRLAPLLRDVLGLDFPDNETTAALTGQARADQTRHLLTQLLQASVTRTPKVLILEDAHWLDSASWALALEASRKVRPLMLVIATRPLAEPLPTEYAQLMQAGNVRRLKLAALPTDDALALVCQRLQVTSLPEPVAALIRTRAEGNPFFSEELAYALRDSGLIELRDGECHLASTADLQAVAFPDTVQGVITSRIDRLTPAQQMTLKVASVIGRVFAFHTLFDIHPIESDRSQLKNHVAMLEQLDLTPLEAPEPDLTYIFKHIITQEVAYNLMLFAQRRELHKTVAEWYEQRHARDLAPYAAVIAHHYHRAELWEKAWYYRFLAGHEAGRLFAHLEARAQYAAALEILTHLPDTTEWQRMHIDTVIQYASVSWANDVEQNITRLRAAEAQLQHFLPEQLGADRLRLGRLLYWLGRIYHVRNDLREAVACYKQVIAIGTEFNDAELLAIPSAFIGQVLMAQGHAFQARALLSQAVEPLTQTGNIGEWIRTVGYLGVAMAAHDHYAAGLDESYRALHRAEALRHGTLQAAVSIYIMVIYMMGRDYPNVAALGEKAQFIAEASGDRLLVHISAAFRAWAAVRQGQLAEAQAHRAHSVAIGQAIGGRLLLADWFMVLDAEIALAAGDLATAEAIAQKTVAATQPLNAVYSQGMAQRVWGQACAAQQQWAAAEEHFAASVALLETGGMKLEAATTYWVWGALCEQHGPAAAARTPWEKALALYQVADLQPHFAELRARLAQLPK